MLGPLFVCFFFGLTETNIFRKRIKRVLYFCKEKISGELNSLLTPNSKLFLGVIIYYFFFECNKKHYFDFIYLFIYY